MQLTRGCGTQSGLHVVGLRSSMFSVALWQHMYAVIGQDVGLIGWRWKALAPLT